MCSFEFFKSDGRKEMRCKSKITAIAASCLAVSILQAQVIPGRWEKMAAEKPGSKITVTLHSGDRIDCSFNHLSADSLLVTTPDGTERILRKTDVATIVTASKRWDSLRNGGIIGLGVGIAIGALGTLAMSEHTEVSGATALGLIAVYAGIGAGIGLAIDAGKRNQLTLYEAHKSRARP
jgi:hypothetical protein